MSTAPAPDPVVPDPATPAPEPAVPAAPAFVPITSQEDFDRRIQDRIARVKNTPPADYADLQAAKLELDEIKAASQTELERLQKQLADTQKRADQAQAAAKAQLVQAAILAEATRQGAVKPEHTHRLLDTEAVTVGDDGQVIGAEDAVRAFLEANPEYVGSTRASGSADQGARGGGANQLTRDDLKNMSSADIVKAQSEGRLDHLLKGS